jgi:hypothetical protein
MAVHIMGLAWVAFESRVSKGVTQMDRNSA